MRIIIFFSLLFIIAGTAHSQTLFTYGGKAVSKNEFAKAFDKNPSADTASRSESLKNYLDLYTKYKLKVQAAYDEKMNTTDEYKSEADNFKKELAETAVNNEANINSLIQEAFLRSRKDLQLSQVFVPIPKNGDTSAAFATINEAYALLTKGTSFDDVAARFAIDSATKNNKGNIGFITVFTLPYEAENIVYRLKPGEYAKPYHSRIGYHIFKLTRERPALGSRKIQYILFAASPVADETEKKGVNRLADSVYSLIQNGASFSDMQAVYGTKKSSSKSTAEVSVGQYSTDFENEVFALQKEGEVSHPFATAYGYNIIKLIEKQSAVSDTSDITVKAAMQEKISADDRLVIAKQNLQKTWLAATGYKPAPYNKEELWKFTDSAIENGNSGAPFKTLNNSTVLFSFTRKKIMVSDWIRYVQMRLQENNTKTGYEQLMPLFISYSTGNYYRQHIDDFHLELKDQLSEFNDANLLFAAMDKHVWSRAAQDTTGLLQYYKAHRRQYVWAPGADAIVMTASSKQIADELAQKIKDSTSHWRDIIDTYGSLAQGDSSRFEQDQLPVKNNADIKAGYLSEPQPVNDGNGYSFIYVTAIHTQPELRSFDEARGMVINDYQQVVEDKWIAELKKKYPVKVNQAVFASIR